MKKKIKKSIKRKINIPLVLTASIVIILIGTVSVLRSQITKLDNEIIAQSSEIKDLEETKMSLEGELQGIVSSNNLKEVAQYRLGMVYPEDNQIVYIDVKDDKQKSDVKNNVFLSPIVSVLKSFTRN
ncbi:cell division protein FtsL [Peptoniphilus duerdenii]|uniref:cell division protein FtsL n=1 Tax=Peptoniphilus duerdenii TaxID=507750 RepID=UPI00254AA688|nr:cell division protein FtsL [Peptoniphilus duerdenii]MDK8276453.1 cell division protein FtsL [Peptoniphilus duerdenii]